MTIESHKSITLILMAILWIVGGNITYFKSMKRQNKKCNFLFANPFQMDSRGWLQTIGLLVIVALLGINSLT